MDLDEVLKLFQGLVKYKNSCDAEDESEEGMKVIDTLEDAIDIVSQDLYYRIENFN